jgi:flagellar protein FliO/FliZ
MPRPTFTDTLAPVALLLLCTPQSAMAAAELGDTTAFFRLTWGLLVVLGIMLILYALVRKRFSLFPSPAKGSIRVLEIRHLMPKKSLCLVEVKGREYLLGISSDSISLIANLPANQENSFAAALEKSAAGIQP